METVRLLNKFPSVRSRDKRRDRKLSCSASQLPHGVCAGAVSVGLDAELPEQPLVKQNKATFRLWWGGQGLLPMPCLCTRKACVPSAAHQN